MPVVRRGADRSEDGGQAPQGTAVSRSGSVPGWLCGIVDAVADVRAEQLSREPLPRDGDGRAAAVLVLFGESAQHGADVLLIERASGLRSHAGTPAFPGGVIDPDDHGPVGAALREAHEETGLHPDGVDVLATLPELWLRAGGYVVTPVLAWWRAPSAVQVVDPVEVAAVHRVPLAQLVDPANRLRVRHSSGYVGQAFRVGNLLVWGFTAALLGGLLEAGGLARPWDRDRVESLPEPQGAHRR
ncbi:MAG: CoA pyrophosphatase [Jiangellaceae bacterium]|nr:CoA pyrophosphatase [Jiangellaceae bacterium]